MKWPAGDRHRRAQQRAYPVITSLTNALDDESVIERLANTTSVQEVLDLLGGKKPDNRIILKGAACCTLRH